MRKLMLLLAAVVAVFAATAAAAPLSGHGAMIARDHAHRVCSTYNLTYNSAYNPGWTKIHWTCNGHNPKWWLRAVSHCQDGRNNIIYVGRAVENVGAVSEASCTAGYPVLAGAGYDAKQCSTCSWKRNWVYGTPVKQ